MAPDNIPDDTDKNILGKLVNQFSEKTPYASNATYQEHVFNQYKLYVEMADRISARRQTASSFFLSINTALLGLLSYFNISNSSLPDNSFYWMVAVAGIALSYLWYRVIRSYRDLNAVKFKIIHEIEKLLPLSPYDAEWEAVGRGEKPKLYLPFTYIEAGIPWVFAGLHFVVFICSFSWEIFKPVIS